VFRAADIGGHLYTCIDKISGQSMFYANPSIKKANIGYRGAWAAFGIEFNFPVSHNWVSMSPVSFAFHPNTDGSASAIVGSVDRVYGMEWTVELVLRPKSTLLEERVTLSNRSDFRHRFYWWNNAGRRSRMTRALFIPCVMPRAMVLPRCNRGLWTLTGRPERDSESYPWCGVSVRPWKPRRLYGSVASCYANWHHAFCRVRAGSCQENLVVGCGRGRPGLAEGPFDDNSAYIEIQGGLFRNQETYAFLEPRQSIHFSEYWMPAREIGGIARANLAGVLVLRARPILLLLDSMRTSHFLTPKFRF